MAEICFFVPPETVVSKELAKKKTPVHTNVDNNKLIKIGLPPVPEKMSDSIYLNAAADVPMAWRRAAHRFLQDRQDEQECRRLFVMESGLDWRTIHILVHLIRTRKTTHCYDTNGQINLKTEFSVRKTKANWKGAKKDYYNTLHTVASAIGDRSVDVFGCDTRIRAMRSAQPDNPFASITTKDGRQFCFIDYVNDQGCDQYSWIEVTLSSDLSPILPITPKSDQYHCHVKDCKVDNNLLQCSRCKNVFYCTSLHQKEDWSSHKLNCK